ncbi:hypothetical protein E2I00_018968, partial [Balaenoptera physalus]
ETLLNIIVVFLNSPKYWLDPAKTLAEHKELINTSVLLLPAHANPRVLQVQVQFQILFHLDLRILCILVLNSMPKIHVKQDVLQGRLPCPVNTAAQLGAYAIQSELGDYDPYKHTAGYVSEYRFVPDQKEELEEAIERIHKTLMGQAPSEAELNYLRTAKSLEMYGVDLHPVYGENKSEYFLGLTPVGVVVYKNKKQVGKYFWPRITKVHFKETQFELRVLGKDNTTYRGYSEFFIWLCTRDEKAVDNMGKVIKTNIVPTVSHTQTAMKPHSFLKLEAFWRYPGMKEELWKHRTALQMSRDLSIQLPRPDQNVARSRSKTYPKRIAPTQPAGVQRQGRQPEHSCKSARQRSLRVKQEARWQEGKVHVLYSPFSDKLLAAHVGQLKTGREEISENCHTRELEQGILTKSCYVYALMFIIPDEWPDLPPRSDSINRVTANMENGENEGTTKIIAPSPIKRSRSRCNTSSGSESENSNREHRKKRNRIRQENDMVDSAPQWEAVLRRQKEKNQADPNNRRSRHRSRSKELVDPSGLSEEQLKEIPYTKIETQGDPVRIRHSHSPRSYRQYRRSQCSDGERSVLSEVNSKTDLVPPLPVTRSSDAQGSGGSTVHQVSLTRSNPIIHGTCLTKF